MAGTVRVHNLLVASLMFVGSLLLMIGAGLPAWYVEHWVSSKTLFEFQKDQLRDLANPTNGNSFSSTGSPGPQKNTFHEVDCYVGVGWFRYNNLKGDCLECSDTDGQCNTVDQETLWDSFSTTSVFCQDLENPEDVDRPGQKAEIVSMPAIPADQISIKAKAEAARRCNRIRVPQAFSILAILLGVASIPTTVLNLRKIACLCCLFASVCAFSTVFSYQTSDLSRVSRLFGIRDIGKWSNSDPDPISYTYGPAYLCEAAGASFAGICFIFLLVMSSVGKEAYNQHTSPPGTQMA